MYVEIKVADTGKGISESNQAAIFRRFYREEEVHEQQGVGIGLYLAREIITRQGGYIKVVSEPGRGSEFPLCCLQNEVNERGVCIMNKREKAIQLWFELIIFLQKMHCNSKMED